MKLREWHEYMWLPVIVMLASTDKILERAENPDMEFDGDLDDDLATGMEGL